MKSLHANWAVFLITIVISTPGVSSQTSTGRSEQTPSTSDVTPPAVLSETDTARRDSLMKPGVDALRKNDFAAAVDALKPALIAFPKDQNVLRASAEAARGAGKNGEALGLFTRLLAEQPRDPWHIRLAIMQLQAALERWVDFDRELAELRATKKSGTSPELNTSGGFVIDDFQIEGQHVLGTVRPLTNDQFHSLYRFVLAPGFVVKSQSQTPQAGTVPQCWNPQYRPSLDVESDDFEQAEFKKTHPDQAAKGDRSYSMDFYPTQCSQSLIKFYPDGEPSYETVRADAMRTYAAVLKPSK